MLPVLTNYSTNGIFMSEVYVNSHYSFLSHVCTCELVCAGAYVHMCAYVEARGQPVAQVLPVFCFDIVSYWCRSPPVGQPGWA